MRKLSVCMSVTVLVGTMVATVGCKKDKATSPSAAPTSFERVDTAPLWKLIPKQAMIAGVLSEGTPGNLHAGWVRFVADFGKTTLGAKTLAEMAIEAPPLAMAAKPNVATTIGADFSKGAAMYFIDDERPVVVLPITNPKALEQFGKITKDGDYDRFAEDFVCLTKSGYYVCATTKEDVESLGSDDGMLPPTGNMRGHIETLLNAKAIAAINDELNTGGMISSLRGAIVLEPGGYTMRATVGGQWPFTVGVDGPPPLLKDVAAKLPTGLFSLRVGSVMSMLMAQLPPRVLDDPGPGGVTPRALLNALTGDVAGYVLPGEPGGVLAVGIKDKAPFAKFLEMCGQVPIPPEIATLKLENGRCNFTVTPPQMGTFSGAVWIDDDAIRIGFENFEGKRPDAPALARSAKEIIDGKHAYAAWGYGSMMNGNYAMLEQLPDFKKEIANPEAQLGLWALAHLAEFGISVALDDKSLELSYRLRTTWSDPKDVTDKLDPVIGRMSKGDFSARSELAGIAEAHPKSLFASDVKAGYGLLAPASIFGVLAAVAIPAFTKYIKKSKSSESRQFIKKMSDGARAYYLDGSGAAASLTPVAKSFPLKSTELTPPAGSCCGGPDDKCIPKPDQWSDPTWAALNFSVDDPHYYSYQYIAGKDGNSFTARAIGDLDCDGTFSTFEMYGKVEDGMPVGSMDIYRENETE